MATALCLLLLPSAVLSQLFIVNPDNSAGTLVTLRCLSKQKYTKYINFHWTKDNQPIPQHYGLSDDNDLLLIPEASGEDCGLYSCRADFHGKTEEVYFQLYIEGIFPFARNMINIAITGLGCMIAAVSAFMLSTTFESNEMKFKTILRIISLFFMLASFCLLVTAICYSIYINKWTNETVGLLIASIILAIMPLGMIIGMCCQLCNRLWSSPWMPIVIAMFVHIALIITVILLIKNFEASKNGCTGEWPVIYKLVAALFTPILLCASVVIYKNIRKYMQRSKLNFFEIEPEDQNEPSENESELEPGESVAETVAGTQ